MRIIKLGGAILTEKSSLETLNVDAFDRIISHLSTIWHESRSDKSQSSPAELVVVAGVGSFGHSIAKYEKLTHVRCIHLRSWFSASTHTHFH
jgi:isopentenyl phosphate kinase